MSPLSDNSCMAHPRPIPPAIRATVHEKRHGRGHVDITVEGAGTWPISFREAERLRDALDRILTARWEERHP